MRSSDSETVVKNNPGAFIGFESSINAFYRILGFQKFDLKITSPIDEYVNSGINGISKETRLKNIEIRNSEVPESSDLSKDQKIVKALDSIHRPTLLEPQKKLIFPLVWMGSPTPNRKIAAPFDLFQPANNISPPRSLLEAIIEIRVNRFDREYVPPEVKEFFVNQFANLNESQQGTYATFYGTDDINDYSVFSLILLRNFDLVVDKIIAKHYEIEKKKQRLSDKITYVPDSTVYGNPLSKANNVNAKYKRSQFSTLTRQLEQLEVIRDLIQSSTSVIVDTRQDIGRDARGRTVDFLKDNMFLAPVMQVFQSDLLQIKRAISEVKTEIARIDKEMEEVRAISDLFYGTTSGISIIDVFAILWALFEIDKKYLLGLLSEDQFDNYKKFNEIRGFELEESQASAVDSYGELERIILFKIDLISATAKGREKIIVDNSQRGNRGV